MPDWCQAAKAEDQRQFIYKIYKLHKKTYCPKFFRILADITIDGEILKTARLRG